MRMGIPTCVSHQCQDFSTRGDLESYSFGLQIELRMNKSLFRLVSDSLSIWCRIQSDLFGLMPGSSGLKFEKTYGFKRIQRD